MRKPRLGRPLSEYGGAAAQSWVRLLLLSVSSSTPSPGSTEAALLCHSALSPARSIQAAGGGQWQDSVALSGNCPASPNAVTFLLCTALRIHISLLHAHLSVSCTRSLQLGHVTKAQAAHTQQKEISRTAAPTLSLTSQTHARACGPHLDPWDRTVLAPLLEPFAFTCLHCRAVLTDLCVCASTLTGSLRLCGSQMTGLLELRWPLPLL